MKVIVVDDELHALHDFLSAVIGEEEIEYRFFRDDPATILRYAADNEIDGAFLDINMTEINGFELAKKLLEIRPNLKIAFITGLMVREKDIPEKLLSATVSLIHKPYRREDLTEALTKFGNSQPYITAKMLGKFDCFFNDKLILFSSSKAKELLALLLANNGRSVTMDYAIAALYPEKELDKAKILYRDAVWRLRKTLEEIHCPCVVFQRALLLLNKAMVECDYYDLLSGQDVYYGGEFLPEYEWSLPFKQELDARFAK